MFSSLDQVERIAEGAEGEPVPTRVVVLSDGTNTAGRSPEQAAAAAVAGDLPVSTIAYGTPDGIVVTGGRTLEVPVNGETPAPLPTPATLKINRL